MSLRAARLLVATQLRADLRLGRTGQPAARSAARRGVSKLGLTALAYGFSGSVLALSLWGAAPEHVLFVAGSFALVLAAFGIVGSLDELMGRPRENAWLATLPASERTHYAARVAGVGVYLALMGGGVALPVGLSTAWHHGAASGLTVGALVAAAVVWTAALALASVWLVSLHLPLRALRPVLAATRGLLVALLVLGYQWIGMQPEASGAAWWPAAWLADALAGRGSAGVLALGASSALLAALLAAYFPPRYFRLLARLEGAGQPMRTESTGLTWAERMVVHPGAPRAAYGLALASFAGDRIVRGRLWPVALLPLGFVAFGWLAGGLGSLFVHGAASALTNPATQLHLSLLIVLVFCVQTLVQTLQHADHAEASWVFALMPGARPRALWLGAQQALLWRVLVPVHVLFAGGLLFLMPALDALLHALYWFAVSATVTRARALTTRTPPFSQRPDRFSASAHVLPLLLSLPMGALALLVQFVAFASPARALLTVGFVLSLNVAAALLATPKQGGVAGPALAPEPSTH